MSHSLSKSLLFTFLLLTSLTLLTHANTAPYTTEPCIDYHSSDALQAQKEIIIDLLLNHRIGGDGGGYTGGGNGNEGEGSDGETEGNGSNTGNNGNGNSNGNNGNGNGNGNNGNGNGNGGSNGNYNGNNGNGNGNNGNGNGGPNGNNGNGNNGNGNGNNGNGHGAGGNGNGNNGNGNGNSGSNDPTSENTTPQGVIPTTNPGTCPICLPKTYKKVCRSEPISVAKSIDSLASAEVLSTDGGMSNGVRVGLITGGSVTVGIAALVVCCLVSVFTLGSFGVVVWIKTQRKGFFSVYDNNPEKFKDFVRSDAQLAPLLTDGDDSDDSIYSYSDDGEELDEDLPISDDEEHEESADDAFGASDSDAPPEDSDSAFENDEYDD